MCVISGHHFLADKKRNPPLKLINCQLITSQSKILVETEVGWTRQIHQNSRCHRDIFLPRNRISVHREGGGTARTALSSFGHNEGAMGWGGRDDGGEL